MSIGIGTCTIDNYVFTFDIDDNLAVYSDINQYPNSPDFFYEEIGIDGPTVSDITSSEECCLIQEIVRLRNIIDELLPKHPQLVSWRQEQAYRDQKRKESKLERLLENK